MHKLAAHAIRRLGEHAVHFLRLSTRQVHHVRSVIHHAGDYWLSIVEKNLHARQNRPHPRLHFRHQPIYVFGGAAHLEQQHRQDHHLHDQSKRCHYAEDFEPHLHTCPACPARGRTAFPLPDPTTASTPADTL